MTEIFPFSEWQVQELDRLKSQFLADYAEQFTLFCQKEYAFENTTFYPSSSFTAEGNATTS